ncbi:MAG: phage holin family protein [Butyrivibrio sp.]|nr:phage holin family protein [Butyrivibrio sp.]
MEMILNYVKPELVVLAVVLYLIGLALKKAQAVKDKLIPLILGLAGIALALIWVLATSELGSAREILLAVFTAVVQGVLVAGLSTYANQIVKQASKED